MPYYIVIIIGTLIIALGISIVYYCYNNFYDDYEEISQWIAAALISIGSILIVLGFVTYHLSYKTDIFSDTINNETKYYTTEITIPKSNKLLATPIDKDYTNVKYDTLNISNDNICELTYNETINGLIVTKNGLLVYDKTMTSGWYNMPVNKKTTVGFVYNNVKEYVPVLITNDKTEIDAGNDIVEQDTEITNATEQELQYTIKIERNDGTLDTYEAYEYMKYGNGKYAIFLTDGEEIHLTKKDYKTITIETERR